MRAQWPHPKRGFLPYRGLCAKSENKPGQRIVINDAAGGVGTVAIQLAEALGAKVTGVGGTCKMDKMRSHGAEYVIDYTREDFTRNGQHYALILDVKADRSICDYRRVLSSEGISVTVGGRTERI